MNDMPGTTNRPRHRVCLPWRRLVAGGLIATVAGNGVAASLPSGPTRLPPAQALADSIGNAPQPTRVAVLALENKSYGQVIGSPKAPFVNRLAKRSALATNYYGVSHPSLPNYIAMTGGSTSGINNNCARCHTSAPNLVGQLGDAGISWKAYFEGLTSNTVPGHKTHTYNPHYNPFVYFDSVRGNAGARSHVVGFKRFHRDLKRGRLPRFSWIAPSVGHDGHNGSLRGSDRYLSHVVPRVVRALGPHGVFYVVWDEGAPQDRAGVHGSHGGGHVVLIATGGGARKGSQTKTPANHYALLRTIEAGFGLPTLGHAASPATPVMAGLLKQ